MSTDPIPAGSDATHAVGIDMIETDRVARFLRVEILMGIVSSDPDSALATGISPAQYDLLPRHRLRSPAVSASSSFS